MTSRALVVGGDGLIGRALAGESALATTRRRGVESAARPFLDLAQDPSAWPLPAGLSTAYFCAGATSVTDCERDPVGTARVNVSHTAVLARRLADAGVFVVFLSTNIVFDGAAARAKAADPAAPKAEYGRQKLAVERILLEGPGAAAVVRLTKVLGPRPPLFMEWLGALRAGRVVRPFADKVMAPVPLPFVADALRRIGDGRRAGIWQISGPEDVAYADVARFLARRADADERLIEPVAARGRRLAAALMPPHTSLDTGRLEGELGLLPPDVWSTISWSIE